MRLGRKTHVKRTGITFVRLNAFLFAKSEIIINSFVESICKLGYASALKIYKTIDTFDFPEKYPIGFTECNRPDKTLIF